jgi:flagellar biosynthesis protein FlhA
MPPTVSPPGVLRDWPELLLPIGLVASLLVLLAPMPAPLLDLLLVANFAASMLMLLTTVFIRTPLEFSAFPVLLLATTTARLALNVASTRLILTRAHTDGLSAAGDVVRGFGEFVTGDRIVVGLAVFSIIVVIQFVVITRGVTRISEVAARFALDGLPGKQMAIDADLAVGAIDQHEALRRREEVAHQAAFFGAMDGASKFVRGDAIAGLLITLINIAGGLAMGVFELGMDVRSAALLYTKLTIGDGLVAQIPAFLVSLAAGIIVTRRTTPSNLPADFVEQLSACPQALAITAVFLGLLAFAGLPMLPLLALSGLCGGLAWTLKEGPARSKDDDN